ncbi:hypothetical protein R6Q57_023227 [Mikania cordata]
MGFWKKFTGFLRFGPESNGEHEDENEANGNSVEETHNHDYSNLPRKGFSVQVPVDRVHQIGPVLLPCAAGDGGVQGLEWYARRLKVDEDGDVADEFLEEIYPETSSNTQHKQFQYPKIVVKLNAKPARSRNPVLTREGTIQQFVEHQAKRVFGPNNPRAATTDHYQPPETFKAGRWRVPNRGTTTPSRRKLTLRKPPSSPRTFFTPGET